MGKVDFIEIAEYCVKKAKEVPSYVIKHYESTQFVCISKDNSVKCSMTPHILQDAYQCILMHKMRDGYETWYEFEFINEEGLVIASSLENDYNLSSERTRSDFPLISLKHNSKNQIGSYTNHVLYVSRDINKIYELYSEVKDVQSKSERELIIDLFKKDENILELKKQIEDFSFINHLLEQEREQYKNMLDELKNVVESKG